MILSLAVVIPNYNNAHFLEKCVRSVMAQTYEGLKEIIIVDDKSQDDSPQLIKALMQEDARIKGIFLEKNGHVSAARNTGLAATLCEYITFLDADDYYYNKDKLKNEMELVEKHLLCGRDVIAYSGIVRTSYDDTSKTMPSFEGQLEGNVYSRLVTAITLGKIMRDYCVKTELLREVGGYNTERHFFEDYEVVLKLARKTPFYSTGCTGTAYRDSVQGLSKKPYSEQLGAIDEIAFAEISGLHGIKKCRYYCVRRLKGTYKKLGRSIKNKIKN